MKRPFFQISCQPYSTALDWEIDQILSVHMQSVHLRSPIHRNSITCKTVVSIMSFIDLLFHTLVNMLECGCCPVFTICLSSFLWLFLNVICGFKRRRLKNLPGLWRKISYLHMNDCLPPITLSVLKQPPLMPFTT